MIAGKRKKEPIIQVKNISKQYNIGMDRTYKTLSGSITDAVQSPIQTLKRIAKNYESFWVLKDINFEVERGEVIGIIGRNGAGKSTLLKILSRITSPTEGEIRLRGRVGSLLEVGTGFHPELTGRENIYFNGAILGMKRREIEEKFDEIVKFSGVEKFLDTPVKRYSSGMQIRLAFSVAANLDPEILVVDEVLAVGDAQFQKKCLGKMGEVAKEGRTVLFVSHNMGAMRNLCKKGILLEGSRINLIGDIDEVVEHYLVMNNSINDAKDLSERNDRSGSGNVRAIKFFARDGNNSSSELRSMGCAEFVVEYAAREDKPIQRLFAAIGVVNSHGNVVFTCSTAFRNSDFYNIPSKGSVVSRIEEIPLIPGKYSVQIKLMDVNGLSDLIMNAGSFLVGGFGEKDIVNYPSTQWGDFIVSHTWSILNKDV
jgi:ABC-type polysaccharide/polyol phosphate transport system ATPase subunit